MGKPEKLFLQIIKNLSNGVEGKMFGAKCIKSVNDKTAAFYWQDKMVFKLHEETQERAVQLNGAKVGSHLYACEKPMNGWISIPSEHSDKWADFTIKARVYVDGLTK